MCTLLDARSAFIASSCVQDFLLMPTQNHCVRQRKKCAEKKKSANCRSVYISTNNITIYMYICPRLMLIWDCLGSLESLIGLHSLGGFGLFRMVWVEGALLGSLESSPHLRRRSN